MIGHLSILLLLGICLPSSISLQPPSTISLGLSQLIIDNQLNGLTAIQFPCIAFVGSCAFSFKAYPSDWKPSGNKLLIPTSSMKSIKNFLVRADVSEPTGDLMTVAITIDFSSKSQKTRYTILSVGKANLPAIDSPQYTQEVVIISSEKNPFNETYLQAKNIVPYLPSFPKLDSVIASSDQFQMMAAFQNVLEFKQPCIDKVKYLDELVPKIQSHINGARVQLDQSDKDMMMVEKEIQNLKEEEASMKVSLQSIAKTNVIKQLSEARQEKLQTQALLSNTYAEAKIYLQKVQEMKDAVGNSSQIIDIKSSVQSDKRQIFDIDLQLAELMKRKAELESRVSQNEKKIRQYENQYGGSDILAQIASFSDLYDQHMNLAVQYEIKIQSALNRTFMIEQKVRDNYLKTTQIEERMAQIQQLMSNRSMDTLSLAKNKVQTRLDVLERNLPKLTSHLNQCKKQISSLPSSTNKIVSIPDGPDTSVTPKYEMNFFSNNWIVKYGTPSFHSFQCINGQQSESGDGKILQIDNSAMSILKNGRAIILRFAICTKIMTAAFNEAPKMGDTVIWEGYLPGEQGIYNVSKVNVYKNK